MKKATLIIISVLFTINIYSVNLRVQKKASSKTCLF